MTENPLDRFPRPLPDAYPERRLTAFQGLILAALGGALFWGVLIFTILKLIG